LYGVSSPGILSGALSAAAIVLFAAAYAGFFAAGRMTGRSVWRKLSYVAYALVVAAAVVYARALQLHGYWWALIGIFLAGYALAPRAIWRLCVGTHGRAAMREST
jgi:apolipoprotein N-acyltransferase